LKFLQVRKQAVALAILGATLLIIPAAAAQTDFLFTGVEGNQVNVSNATPGTFYVGDSSLTVNSTLPSQYTFLGTGGNDTFAIWGGNSSITGVATGIGNDTFYIESGIGMTNDTYGLVTGSHACFDIFDLTNGTLRYGITSGPFTIINEYVSPTAVPFCAQNSNIPNGATPFAGSPPGTPGGGGPMFYNINSGKNTTITFNGGYGGNDVFNIAVGTNSSVTFGGVFRGNETVNILF